MQHENKAGLSSYQWQRKKDRKEKYTHIYSMRQHRRNSASYRLLTNNVLEEQFCRVAGAS